MRPKDFLSALFPPFCLLCGGVSDGEFPHCCPTCRGAFRRIHHAVCVVCGLPFHPDDGPHTCLDCILKSPPFMWCRGLYHYDLIMAGAISLLKYGRRLSMLDVLTSVMDEALVGLEMPEVDVVVPVPLTRLRMIRRGFNQSGALVLPLARRLGIPLLHGVIVRRGNRPQAGLSGRKRDENARRAFRQGQSVGKVAGRRVLLFDDVYTTGATVRSCSRILRQAGGRVVVLTLARVVPGEYSGQFIVDDAV